jgi:hypothetical protein
LPVSELCKHFSGVTFSRHSMSVHSQSREDKGPLCPEPQCQVKQFKTAIALASHRNHCHTAEYPKFGKVRARRKVFLTPSKISPSFILRFYSISRDSKRSGFVYTHERLPRFHRLGCFNVRQLSQLNTSCKFNINSKD